jgi:hypothetical protein
MQRIRDVIQTMDTPSWLESVPHNFGDANVGTLKAAQWRALATVYFPVALISLWGEGTSHPSPEAARSARRILDHTMLLVCAAILLCYHSSTTNRTHTFLTYILAYIKDLRVLHPDAKHHSIHHMAVHLRDFLILFGPVRNWWTFPFERLIGHLQRLPQNHRFSQLHVTLTHTFIRAGNLKRWLASSECPEILRYCKAIFDKAFSQNLQDESAANGDEDMKPNPQKQRTPDDLKNLSRSNTVALQAHHHHNGVVFSRSSTHMGNSLIHFYPNGSKLLSPVPGAITYIYHTDGAPITYAVRRQLPKATPPVSPDPYQAYPNFPAKLYSAALSENLEMVKPEWVLAHYARWRLSPSDVVVLSLSRVSPSRSSYVSYGANI